MIKLDFATWLARSAGSGPMGSDEIIMPDSCDAGRSDVERRVLEVTSTYVALEKTGAAPDRDALLAAHPDLTQELLAFLEDRDTRRQSVADEGTDPPRTGEVTAGTDSSSPSDVTTDGAGERGVRHATSQDTAGTKTSGAESDLSTANDDHDLRVLKNVMELVASERRFGDYELLCELGRGGMGVVIRPGNSASIGWLRSRCSNHGCWRPRRT